MKTNAYQEVLSDEFYNKTPKQVLAAICVSYALRQYEDDFSKVEQELLNEWKILHINGIVIQKPYNQNNNT